MHVFHKSFLLKPNGYRRRRTKQTQVISLEEFVIHDADEEVNGATGEDWHYECRCDGTYRVTEDDLECGRHLVGCQSCSEVLWVGYELVED